MLPPYGCAAFFLPDIVLDREHPRDIILGSQFPFHW
jgi:hypothetical protein